MKDTAFSAETELRHKDSKHCCSTRGISIGTIVGILLGMMIGVFFDKMLTGMIIGFSLGMGIGGVLDARKNRSKKT